MKDKRQEEISEAIKSFREKVKNWTKQQCLDYLVKLGTHNPDGTLHENYGGKKNEPSKTNSKKLNN